jgi:hypothetical protein
MPAASLTDRLTAILGAYILWTVQVWNQLEGESMLFRTACDETHLDAQLRVSPFLAVLGAKLIYVSMQHREQVGLLSSRSRVQLIASI